MAHKVTEAEEIDAKRKDLLYTVNDLTDLLWWLEDGYKDCEGKTVTVALIREKIEVCKKEADELFRKLFPNIK